MWYYINTINIIPLFHVRGVVVLGVTDEVEGGWEVAASNQLANLEVAASKQLANS